MHLIFCLSHILTDFRPLFNRQSFDLFCTFSGKCLYAWLSWGIIFCVEPSPMRSSIGCHLLSSTKNGETQEIWQTS